MKYIAQTERYNPCPATIPDFYDFTNDLGLLYYYSLSPFGVYSNENCCNRAKALTSIGFIRAISKVFCDIIKDLFFNLDNQI
ncbi:hypothetical protein [Moorena sp. SIO4G3]|uniref:hypothetical protein n=1 Tax=Moorena sp. SIO4G3 TaxID=2607821 RepID=UPI001429D73E|nr:hypothetical protein [Moorena sp. SIO4G3]NEO79113.1 hypothetical protein [Moorena sp. SIO4G3]